MTTPNEPQPPGRQRVRCAECDAPFEVMDNQAEVVKIADFDPTQEERHYLVHDECYLAHQDKWELA